ncbi:MAG: transcription elongation factor GreA [Oscillospiraceae bacterium]
MAAAKKEYRMSEVRYDELSDELNYLKTVREKEVAEQIKEARGFGDLSENSEYDEAKNEQGKLYSRIAELEEILLHSTILSENVTTSNQVTIGCRVTVINQETGEELPVYKIVGSQESDPMNGSISEESPFGKALINSVEGDVVRVEAPRGVLNYLIKKIER